MSCIFVALLSISVSQAYTGYKISKNATRCDGDNCSYKNMSFDMKCSFSKTGKITITKKQILGMIGPEIPLGTRSKQMTEGDAQEMDSLLRVVETQNNLKRRRVSQDKKYYLFPYFYAIQDNYVLTSDILGTNFHVSHQNSSSVAMIDSPEAERLVELTDEYCQWSFLSLN